MGPVVNVNLTCSGFTGGGGEGSETSIRDMLDVDNWKASTEAGQQSLSDYRAVFWRIVLASGGGGGGGSTPPWLPFRFLAGKVTP